MNPLKYVITNKGNFAIFTSSTEHLTIGRNLYGKPIAAGFCYFETKVDPDSNGFIQKIICYGKSTSLGLASRGDIDADIINKHL